MEYDKFYKIMEPCESINAINKFLKDNPKSKEWVKVRVLYHDRYLKCNSWVNMYVKVSIENEVGYVRLAGSLDNDDDKGNYNAFLSAGYTNEYNTINANIHMYHEILRVIPKTEDDGNLSLSISKL